MVFEEEAVPINLAVHFSSSEWQNKLLPGDDWVEIEIS